MNSKPWRYITNADGEHVGVVLELEEYQRLTQLAPPDPELLSGMSHEELDALAHSTLAPLEQARLDDLLARHATAQLTGAEQMALDHLLQMVDHLTLIKTRARYTLAQQASSHTKP